VRAKNILGQEGFCTNQISPVNSEFGFGQVFPASTRFNYGQYTTLTEDPAEPLVVGDTLSAWPNPFNPSVNIAYRLGQASKVRVQLIDLGGRIVRSGEMQRPAGVQSEQLNFTGLSSGVYLVSVDVGKTRVLRTRVVYTK
jgi:hypothetical protein